MNVLVTHYPHRPTHLFPPPVYREEHAALIDPHTCSRPVNLAIYNRNEFMPVAVSVSDF
jgi:hypothetical protein